MPNGDAIGRAIRRHRVPSDAIRRDQTRSGAMGRNQAHSAPLLPLLLRLEDDPIMGRNQAQSWDAIRRTQFRHLPLLLRLEDDILGLDVAMDDAA